MAKKSIIVGATCALLLLGVGTAVWAKQEQWNLFSKKEGLFQMQDGVLTKMPDEEEKDLLVKSFDPVTGKPTMELEVKSANETKFEKVKISSKINGSERVFSFTYSYNGSKPVLLTNNDEEYVITSIPNSNLSIIEYNENLYYVDVMNKKIEPVLLDETGSYHIETLSEEGATPTWGSKAKFNSDGSKLLFYTTRNIVDGNNLNGETWIKNLETGEESPLFEGGYAKAEWGGDSLYLFRHERIDIVSTIDKNSRTIYDFVLNAEFSYPYLIHQDQYGEILVTNFETKETRSMKPDTLNVVSSYRSFDGSPWIMIFNAPERSKPERNLIVLNMESGEYKKIDEPVDSFFTEGQWINEQEFLVNTRQIGSNAEETYFVDLNDLEVK